MAKYNGHKNWNHWNVCLWLTNDEALYNEMKRCIRLAKNCTNSTRDDAAAYMLHNLHAQGVTHTPDGAPYSKSAIRAAMVGL